MKSAKIYLYLIFFILLTSCGGSKQIFSSTDDTATFLPIMIEAYVDAFVDEIDGTKTNFNLDDSAVVDAGKHSVVFRLEYQPASGSAIVVGGLANLLLRATTNRTFRTTIDIEVEKDNDYRFEVVDFEDGFAIKLLNETQNTEDLEHRFEIRDGRFERVF